MRKLLLVLAVLFFFNGIAEAQTNKRYGFTHTIRLRHTSKAFLFRKVQDWIQTNLPANRFVMQEIEPEEAYLFGRGTNISSFGTVKYDLTFYVDNNVVDVIADNVQHSKEGRQPREIRGKGTPKQHTKAYLNAISVNLREYLLQEPRGTRFSNK